MIRVNAASSPVPQQARRRGSTRFVSIAFHLDQRAHPRMDAALEKVIAGAKPAKFSRVTGCERRCTGASGRERQSYVQGRDKSATEVRHFRKGAPCRRDSSRARSGAVPQSRRTRFESPRRMTDDGRGVNRSEQGIELGEGHVAMFSKRRWWSPPWVGRISIQDRDLPPLLR